MKIAPKRDYCQKYAKQQRKYWMSKELLCPNNLTYISIANDRLWLKINKHEAVASCLTKKSSLTY